MNCLKKIKKEICLGRLVWLVPPVMGEDALYAKAFLSVLGYVDSEVLYFSALDFIQNAKNRFNMSVLAAPRVLIIGELESLHLSLLDDFWQELEKSKAVKLQYDVNFVVVSAGLSEFTPDLKRLNPVMIDVFGFEGDFVADEVIHDWIEQASKEFGKNILSISVDSANLLESLYFKFGDSFTRSLIYKAIEETSGNQLDLKAFFESRQNEHLIQA